MSKSLYSLPLQDQEKNFSCYNGQPVEKYLKSDYYRKIYQYILGKKVLDVGCIDDGEENVNKIRLWNHWFMVKTASDVVGIDIRTAPIRQLKELGFKVKRMDAQNIKFNTKFDVVFAGELIEHLPNPGLFLASSASVLKEHGRIVLSTPNPFSLNRLVRVVQFRTNEPAVNPDHTLYFSPQNIRTLAQKCNLQVVKIVYAHFPFTQSSWLIKLNQIGCRILGEKFKEQMIVFIANKR